MKDLGYLFIPPRRLLIFALAASAGAACAAPVVERFEPVVNDASSGLYGMSNHWGQHQPRITRHADGTFRLLYLNAATDGSLRWRLMKREAAGGWWQEATGVTNDDAVLLRDPVTDRAHVLAWPYGLPATHTSPGFEAMAIPGAWQPMGNTSRHYGNAGIGRDGTVCLKVSHEFSVLPLTSVTNTEYACGSPGSSGQWSWGPMVSHAIGLRHAYDYLFVNPAGYARGLYATSTRDIDKSASETPYAANTKYVFNGTRFYSSGLAIDSGWTQITTNAPVPAPSTAASAPTLRLTESLVDSRGRVFSGYYVEDPAKPSTSGLYLHVANGVGATLFRSKWASLPTYGQVRLFEDGKQRLWLLWSGQGVRSSSVRLYPVVESGTSAAPVFSVSTYTDLSSAFWPYVVQGALYLAAPRGGNGASLKIDAIFNACYCSYVSGQDFNTKYCYMETNGIRRGQRVFYVRIGLPE